jgi:hypothetical protein
MKAFLASMIGGACVLAGACAANPGELSDGDADRAIAREGLVSFALSACPVGAHRERDSCVIEPTELAPLAAIEPEGTRGGGPVPAIENAESPGSGTPPSRCSGLSTEECMARCFAGSILHCMELARSGDRDATYWFLMGCIGGSSEGCMGVGKAYERGEFGAPDRLAATNWYRRAGYVP